MIRTASTLASGAIWRTMPEMNVQWPESESSSPTSGSAVIGVSHGCLISWRGLSPFASAFLPSSRMAFWMPRSTDMKPSPLLAGSRL